jgi:hypothetical protein
MVFNMKATIHAGTPYYLRNEPNEVPKVMEVDTEAELISMDEYVNIYELNGVAIFTNPKEDR